MRLRSKGCAERQMPTDTAHTHTKAQHPFIIHQLQYQGASLTMSLTGSAEVALQNSTAAWQEVPPSTAPCAGSPTSTKPPQPFQHSPCPQLPAQLPAAAQGGRLFSPPSLNSSQEKPQQNVCTHTHTQRKHGGERISPKQTGTNPLKSPTSTGMGLAAVTPSIFAAQTAQHCFRGAWEWGT